MVSINIGKGGEEHHSITKGGRWVTRKGRKEGATVRHKSGKGNLALVAYEGESKRRKKDSEFFIKKRRNLAEPEGNCKKEGTVSSGGRRRECHQGNNNKDRGNL